MTIQRSGPTPSFLDYALGNALIPKTNFAPSELKNLVAHNFQWIDVPNYQRGIAWDVTNIEELIDSDSILLGNIIFGQFLVNNQFDYLPATIQHYSVLVDGLQRFSVATLILTVLHPLVLAAEPLNAANASSFAALSARCRPLSPIYLYNDIELGNHPRKAIAGSYKNLKEDYKQNIEQRFDDGEGNLIAEEVLDLFLRRQIAIDIYFNFNNPLEIMNTFLGINTVRVDLGPVDLLRSYIVERAVASGWNEAEIEDMENRFTDLFSQNDKPRTELLPFVAIVLTKIAGHSLNPKVVFPSWDNSLLLTEVYEFLDFVEEFTNCTNNGYVNEIRNCGSIPVASILSYYYYKFRNIDNNKPSFFNNGQAENEELHRFLCSTYRALFAGKIGRTRNYAERLFDGTDLSLSDTANRMSKLFLGNEVDEHVDINWLKTILKRIDKKKSPRVFNALRLPDKSGGFGRSFLPDIYGSRAVNYNVDHLIPSAVTDPNGPGAAETQTLPNFAPLTSNHNVVARATPCSSKLSLDGIYSNYASSSTNPHPYCEWLVSNQGQYGSDLDIQDYLEPNNNPNIGNERIEWISDKLISKL